jgi:hypothetical protein
LPRWSADAERFIKSLVAVAFGVELREVLVAPAVEDEVLRERLAEAEEVMDDAPLAAFDASCAAFDRVREKWDEERQRATGYRPLAPFRLHDPTTDHVRRSLETIEDLGATLPFASNPGEYFWFRVVRANRTATGIVSPEEARRAFHFVLDWILRWQSFSTRYAERIMAEWQRTDKPPPRTEDWAAGPVVLDLRVEPVDNREPSQATLAVQLGNLPDDHEQWLEAMRAAFKDEATRVYEQGLDLHSHVLTGAGELRIFHFPHEEAEWQLLVEAIQRSLEDAALRFEDARRRTEAWESEKATLLAPYEQLLGRLALEGEPLFGALVADRSPMFDTDTPSFEAEVELLASDTDAASIGHELWVALGNQGAGPPDWSVEVVGRDDTRLRFSSALNPAQLEGLLSSALTAVEQKREEQRQTEESIRSAARLAEKELRRRLNLA